MWCKEFVDIYFPGMRIEGSAIAKLFVLLKSVYLYKRWKTFHYLRIVLIDHYYDNNFGTQDEKKKRRCKISRFEGNMRIWRQIRDLKNRESESCKHVSKYENRKSKWWVNGGMGLMIGGIVRGGHKSDFWTWENAQNNLYLKSRPKIFFSMIFLNIIFDSEIFFKNANIYSEIC